MKNDIGYGASDFHRRSSSNKAAETCIHGRNDGIDIRARTYVLVITSCKEVEIDIILQRRFKMADGWMSKLNTLDDLIENKVDEFIVPLLQGNILSPSNLEGDIANFIETEQLLEYDGFKSSFLQVRGSIPLLWEQIVDLSYKPRLSIIEHEDT
ncbi:phosphoinositide phosphatase SAC8 isoform X1, partial [Tanacetum coccineum]